jgi:hypothetical protein
MDLPDREETVPRLFLPELLGVLEGVNGPAVV